MNHPAPNRFFIILILGALSTVSPIAIDMYLPAFKEIAAALHTSPAKVSLSLSSYFIGLAAGQLVYGPLLDRFGRKKPLYFGMILFMLASFFCMQARTVESLVVLRFVQALGGCAAQVAAMAMVRDFFPIKDTAKILSLLILILGVSPLLAPTIGSFIAVALGWQWVFVVLATLVLVLLAVVFFFLPEGHRPDKTISLHPVPILRNFAAILEFPQFYTYALAGAFSFAGVLVYVAGSPIIFMDYFHVTPKGYGAIFAGLSVGFIGSNQVNILLLRKFNSAQIFRGALMLECAMTLIFLAGTHFHWFGLATTLIMLFILLSCLGLTYPNAAALALAPFDKNIGSASALLGFIQIGAAALTSAGVGILNTQSIFPVFAIFTATAWIALIIFSLGRRYIPFESPVPKNEVAAVLH
jgi:DHA1 family bicyclomycin/chloramphenicol resistance-like MFS transporter